MSLGTSGEEVNVFVVNPVVNYDVAPGSGSYDVRHGIQVSPDALGKFDSGNGWVVEHL